MMWEVGGGSGADDGDAGGDGRRKPSWRERENNRRRERRRRAISAKIYTGLRTQGNYYLPKHCDNNEVLKALCNEAGWIVEPDGTTYRKGCRPCPMEIGGTSTNITPSSSLNTSAPSSYFASPIRSYQPSPLSSSCPSPTHDDPNALSPNLFAYLLNSFHSSLPPHRISNSCPVTPPFASPKQTFTLESLENLAKNSMSALNIPLFAVSAPPSPTRVQRFTPNTTIHECDESDDTSTIDSGQWMNFQAYANAANIMIPTSPTFNLMKPMASEGIPSNLLDKGKGKEFDFEDMAVKAWEGERSHEVRMDDLELTLGNENTRV